VAKFSRCPASAAAAAAAAVAAAAAAAPTAVFCGMHRSQLGARVLM